MKPLGNRVVIKLKPVLTKSAGGIILATSTPNKKENTTEGIVVSFGKDVSNDELKIGDNVLFDKYAGTAFKIENDESDYVIIREDDIFGIM